jgi:hypothetical protein
MKMRTIAALSLLMTCAAFASVPNPECNCGKPKPKQDEVAAAVVVVNAPNPECGCSRPPIVQPRDGSTTVCEKSCPTTGEKSCQTEAKVSAPNPSCDACECTKIWPPATEEVVAATAAVCETK